MAVQAVPCPNAQVSKQIAWCYDSTDKFKILVIQRKLDLAGGRCAVRQVNVNVNVNNLLAMSIWDFDISR